MAFMKITLSNFEITITNIIRNYNWWFETWLSSQKRKYNANWTIRLWLKLSTLTSLWKVNNITHTLMDLQTTKNFT